MSCQLILKKKRFFFVGLKLSILLLLFTVFSFVPLWQPLGISLSQAALASPAVSMPVDTTASESTVNGNGKATSTIPIEVPPGTNDIQPNLSREYDIQQEGGLLKAPTSSLRLSSCYLPEEEETALQYYQCNVDFDNFVYTSGQTSHVFEQQSNNPCVWVSRTVPTFHLTSVPKSWGELHVTFQTGGNSRCGVDIVHGVQCSINPSPLNSCTSSEANIAIDACTGFARACEGR